MFRWTRKLNPTATNCRALAVLRAHLMLRSRSPLLQLRFPFPCTRIAGSRSETTAASSRRACEGSRDAIASLNRLIIGHSRAGDLASARNVFDLMAERDVVSWNSIMSAYVQHCRYDAVLQLLPDMRRCGLVPSHTSVSTVLSACAELRALSPGRQLHGLSVKTSAASNVFVGTSLITMYAKCGACQWLIRVFEDIQRPSVASWNALISGFAQNLLVCDARKIFDSMPTRNVISWTAMIRGHFEAKEVSPALELFNTMPVKNSVTRSIMVGGFASNGLQKEAIHFFNGMLNHGVRASEASIISAICASSILKDAMLARAIHGYTIKVGFVYDEGIEASLVLMYSRCLGTEEAKLEFGKMETKFVGSCNSLLSSFVNNDHIDEARCFFDAMDEKDKISWNLIISGYLKLKRTDEALELYSKMPEQTIETLTVLMSALIDDGKLEEAEKLFNLMPEGDTIAYTTLISGYLEHGLLQSAMNLYTQMLEPSVVTCNIMISGLMKHGKVNEAFNIFNQFPQHETSSWDTLITGFVHNCLHLQAFLLLKRMLYSGMKPSGLVLASLLSASSMLPLLVHGQQIHPVIIKLGYETCLMVGNALIHMYSKFGDILVAKLVFDGMGHRDVVTWNCMIYGYALNGFSENAIQMFEDIKSAKIKPDRVTFLGLLSACSHTGLMEEALQYFKLMRYDYGIIPGIEHYTCMVDLFCRMDMIEWAERLILSMPFQPDPIIWTSILSVCSSNGHVALAEHATDQLWELDPTNMMPFSHLVNAYGSAERWDDLGNLRKQIHAQHVRRKHGCSWI